jgi:hypothetical protein
MMWLESEAKMNLLWFQLVSIRRRGDISGAIARLRDTSP